jgi:hypothetical protein
MKIFRPFSQRHIISLLFFFFLISYAKLHAQSKWEYGLGLGINFSKIDYVDIAQTGQIIIGNDQSYNILSSIKSRIAYKVSNKLKFNANLDVNLLGTKAKFSDYAVRGIFLEVTPSIEYKLSTKFSIFAGPSYNYTAKLSHKIIDNYLSITDDVPNRWIIGISGGISYLVKHNISLNLRFSQQVNQVHQQILVDVNGDPAGSNRGRLHFFQMSFMYLK